MNQIVDKREHNRKIFNKCEQLIILEIGFDLIPSASSFTEYVSNIYGFSKSTAWYNLKNLKNKKILDFATKINPTQILALTKKGIRYLGPIKKQKISLINHFNSRYAKLEQRNYNNFKYYDKESISINLPLT